MDLGNFDLKSCKCGLLIDTNKAVRCEVAKKDESDNRYYYANGFICPSCKCANITDMEYIITDEDIENKYKNYCINVVEE